MKLQNFLFSKRTAWELMPNELIKKLKEIE